MAMWPEMPLRTSLKKNFTVVLALYLKDFSNLSITELNLFDIHLEKTFLYFLILLCRCVI